MIIVKTFIHGDGQAVIATQRVDYVCSSPVHIIYFSAPFHVCVRCRFFNNTTMMTGSWSWDNSTD